MMRKSGKKESNVHFSANVKSVERKSFALHSLIRRYVEYDLSINCIPQGL